MPELESSLQFLTYLQSSSQETVGEILESMQRWERRNENHHNEKRITDRSPYLTNVPVITSVDPELELFRISTSVCVFLTGRNISPSGISLMGSYKLEPATITDDTPFIRLDQLFHSGSSCSLRLSTHEGPTWINAEVMRYRNARPDFIELGLRFLDKMPADQPFFMESERAFQSASSSCW